MSLLWLKTSSKSIEDLHQMFKDGDPQAPGDDGVSETQEIPFADSHHMVADWLEAQPHEVRYDLKHIPTDKFAHRGHSFDHDPWEKDYIQGMAHHLRSGGQLPPLMAADVPGESWGQKSAEPVTIIDGAHRAAAHVIAGSKTIPIWVGTKQ